MPTTLSPPLDAARLTANYSSRVHSAAVVHFARTVVALAAPRSINRAKALLFAATQLGSFGELVGLELAATSLFTPSVMERCVRHRQRALSAATTLTLATNLRALARVVATPPTAPALQLSRTRAHHPYSHHEISRYLALATYQPTPARRARASALVALGAGAGLTSSDLRLVRGPDVQPRSGGLVVMISGAHPRVVPVLARYHDVLVGAARFAGDQFIIGGDESTRPNVTNRLVSSLSGGEDLERLSIRRLRSTWLAQVAELIGLRTFLVAAGLTCSQHLGDLAALCELASETAMVQLLGGCSG
jgi:integrase